MIDDRGSRLIDRRTRSQDPLDLQNGPVQIENAVRARGPPGLRPHDITIRNKRLDPEGGLGKIDRNSPIDFGDRMGDLERRMEALEPMSSDGPGVPTVLDGITFEREHPMATTHHWIGSPLSVEMRENEVSNAKIESRRPRDGYRLGLRTATGVGQRDDVLVFENRIGTHMHQIHVAEANVGEDHASTGELPAPTLACRADEDDIGLQDGFRERRITTHGTA